MAGGRKPEDEAQRYSKVMTLEGIVLEDIVLEIHDLFVGEYGLNGGYFTCVDGLNE